MDLKIKHSKEEVCKLLEPDFEAGKLYWRPRDISMFANLKSWKTWNTRFAGKEAFTATSMGYHVGAIYGSMYFAHRVLWLLHTGSWPQQIDHINGCRADNRISNIRAVSSLENRRNVCRQGRNKSGVPGVGWKKDEQKWEARIWDNGKKVYLGVFLKLEDAIAARKAAEAKIGFHPNHGRAFA